MKFAKARELIRGAAGYRVTFEVIEGSILRSDHFPDNDEDTIPIEEEAWQLARLFAKAREKEGIVNVYVVHGDDYTPVTGYKEKELNIYPPPTEDEKEYWYCIIGPVDDYDLAHPDDLSLRNAVQNAFKALIGHDADHCYTAWGISEAAKERMLLARLD